MTTKTTTTAATSPARDIPHSVPDEQRPTILGAQGTDPAHARRLLDAGAKSREERGAISFPVRASTSSTRTKPAWRPIGPLPWFEP